MNVSTHIHTIAAGDTVRISRQGNFVRGMASDDDYQVRLDDGAPVEMKTGTAFGGASGGSFKSVELINTSAVSQTIEIIIADVQVWDNRLVGQVDINGGIRAAGNRSANYGAVSVGATATLIRAADANRGSILLQPAGDIFVGTDASVTVANGIKVASGSSGTFTLQTDIYAIAAGATDTRYLEELL